MLPMLGFVTIALPDDPQTLLKEVQGHYASLKKFEATIEHHNDSGLFPGDYTQKLIWTGKGKFSLKVTKPSAYKPTEDKPGGLAPDYEANGTDVTRTQPDGSVSSESVTPRPNTSPGWEVSGGLAISFLEKTKTAEMILNPPAEFKLTWSSGTARKWQEQPVREIVAQFNGRAQKIHLYLDPHKPVIVGVSAEGGLNGWMIYRDVKFETN